ncbi:hypothetical protein DM02DRAFT_666930 [Periconia macrospinosa]|uniref:Uncharacterized protein n=1 Tax=Periconia macrospinosa TaxID=97972 RepID=A0A2V1ED45_9PLEO|nr:hypothetical protein DM02DRAFT_666930 [Periconia macrospinosa]
MRVEKTDSRIQAADREAAGEMPNAHRPTRLDETGHHAAAEALEGVGNGGGVKIAAFPSNNNAKSVDIASALDLDSGPTGADSDDASSEGSIDSDKTIKGDNQHDPLYSPLRGCSLGQGKNGNPSNSSQTIAKAHSSGNEFNDLEQTNNLPSASYTSLDESIHSRATDHRKESFRPADHLSQEAALETQFKANGTQINDDGLTNSSAKSKSVGFRDSYNHTPGKYIDPSRVPLPQTPIGHSYDISAAVISPVSTPQRLASFLPSMRHRRSLSLKLVPSPLGPGHTSDDLGSDTSGLVASPTANNNITNGVALNSPSATTTGSGQNFQNSSPPVLNGRTPGVSNLPFIPASPSIILKAQSSSHQRFSSIDSLLGKSPQNQAPGKLNGAPQPLRGSSKNMSVPQNFSGSSARVSLPSPSPVSGVRFTAPSSMAHGSNYGVHPIARLNNLYTANDSDPFVDDEPTSARTLPSSLPSPLPVYPSTRNVRDAIRDEWIRTQAARITTLYRNMQTLQQKYNNNPAGFTEAEVKAYNTTRIQLEKALSLDAQVESRRSLFMPEGVKPLRTPVEEDAFKGTVSEASGNRNQSQVGGENGNRNGVNLHPQSHLLGFRMALMERQCQAVVDSKGSETAGWSRVLNGLDNEDKKAMRKRTVDDIRGSTERRMENRERNMRNL